MRDNDLWIRLILGSPCIGLAVWFMLHESNPNSGMLSVFPCLLAFALIVFPSITSEGGRILSQIILPHQDAAPRPNTSRADALRFQGEPVDALRAYRTLALAFPGRPDLWHTCFEIAWVELRDREIAADLHRSALRASEDVELHRRLTHLYLIQAQRHPDYDSFAAEEEESIERRMRVAGRRSTST